MNANPIRCLNGSSPLVRSGKVPIDVITLPSGRALTVHRLDRCYPVGCGNKGPKLIERLHEYVRRGDRGVVTVGGAFSNHVHALAALGHRMGVPTAAIIRGTDPDFDNPTLADARRWGMRLITVDRASYASRDSEPFRQWAAAQCPGFALVPEGGNDASSEAACAALAGQLAVPAGAALVVAAGTGATARGLARGFGSRVSVVAADVVGSDADGLVGSSPAAVRCVDARLNGYGRVTPAFLAWLSDTWEQTGVLFDPLYNGKAAYWIETAQCEGAHLLHTGGLQGWRGIAGRGQLAAYPLLQAAVSALRF